MKKLQTTTFKLLDILVILTMLFGAPMNVAAAPRAQAESPTLISDQSDYAAGETAHISGGGFAPGEYALAAMGPDGSVSNWPSVTADENGNFASDSPALDSAGSYEVRAYASGWAGDWSEEAEASLSFTVTAPSAPTEPPAATSEPTSEPTLEPTATEPATAEPTQPPTVELTTEPTQEPTPSGPPTIMSDQLDYPPGGFVTLTGQNWQPGESVHIFVNDNVGQTWNRSSDVVAADDGTILDQFYLPSVFIASYRVTATGVSGTAVTTFTDAIGLNLDQCQNIDLSHLNDPCGTVPAVSHPNWSNGNVNGSNSQYREGDGLPYRNAITKLPNGTWTVRIDYDFTKGGVFAVDRLTRFNLTQDANPCLSTNEVACTLGAFAFEFTMPSEVVSPDATHPALPNSGAVHIAGDGSLSLPNDAQMRVWVEGGTATFISTGQNNTGVQATSFNDNRVLQNGLSTGDSDREFAFKFTLSGCPQAGCNVMTAWSGHIASAVDWGAGKGAASISGSPFHMRIVGVDNLHGTSGGNQDRSVQLSAVVQTLEVKKVCVPGTDTGKFNLQIDSVTKATDASCGGTTGPQSVTAAGHTVGETGGTGTTLSDYTSSISCVNASGNVIASGSGTSLSVSVVAGDNVTCTITNTRRPKLTVTKVLVPSGDTGKFNLQINGTTYATDAGNGGTTGPQFANIGSNSVGETAGTGTTLSNYTSSISCSNGASGSGTSLSLTLAAGDNVTCTITNSRQLGTITIIKDTVPNDPQDFNYTTTGTGLASFRLDDDADVVLSNTQTFSNLNPGAYTVTEVLPVTGFDLTNLRCIDPDDGSSTNLGTGTATIDLDPGETVTCTYTNTKRGRIIVEKQTEPNGSSQSFEFDPSYTSNFFLTDGQQNNSGLLTPGIYSVAEVNLPTGWNLTDTTCSDGSLASAINLGAGETVTCVFTNTLSAEDLTVTKTATPSLTRTFRWDIDKSVDETTINIAEGGTATFNYTVDVTHDAGTDSAWQVTGTINVANPNAYSVSGVSVTDAINDLNASCDVTGGNSTIAANSSETFDYTCTYSEAPADSSQTNTATATWTPFGSPNASASGTANVDWSTASATLVDDNVSVDDPLDPAPPHTFSYTDPSPSSFSYEFSTQGVAGECTEYDNTATFTTDDTPTTGSDTVTVTVCVGLDLTVEKTATASKDRTYKWLIDKSVDDTLIEIADGGTATFNYTVDVTPNGYTDSGFTLGGTITITNPNDWQDVTVDVADTLDQGGTCSITETAPYVVLASDSLVLNYTCTTDGTTTENTATATWDAATYFTPTGTASDDAAVSFALDVETNKDITVIDDKTDPLNPVTLGTSNYFTGPFEFEYALEKQGVAGTCTDYTNTAVIDETDQSDFQTVTVCVGSDLTVTKTAAGTFDRTYLWDIDKNADATDISIAAGGSHTFNYTVDVAQTGISDSGWEVHGTITITNPNDWQAVTLDSLSDAVDNGGTCTVAAGPYTVPADDSINVNYTCSYASAPSSYSGTNTATATWDAATYFTPTGTDSGTAPVTLSQDGATNKTINVTDSYAGPLGSVTATDTAPFATRSFSYTRTVSGVAGTCTEYDNTATITQTGQTADETVTLCVGANLTVSKTANPTFTRQYLWNISKSVDKTLVEQVGGSAVFNYTVQVNQTGFTDSNWAMSGVITVNNPNDWQAVTVNLTDSVNNGGSCSVTNGTGVVVPASGSASRNYTCTFSSGASGINTATATWNAATYFTPSGSASGTASFSFTTPTTTINKTVTVTDTFNGTTTTLGTVTATDGAPFASRTFTYSRSVTMPSFGCQSYTNTAKIVQTNQTASRTITVCGPINLGGKTIGFWQNKNGQDIIKKTAAVSGVCKLTPWLRQFAPFQDLSATASCNTAATYITNIIKAADSSGASMNAMLKAQMLATALDVYYSDAALGGNKIGAPAPIGGVTIDLTYIKANGGYQNVSSAFGGATSLTVMQMLQYAASQSNVGGTMWYGNVKSTQEKAKNAFDAINNNWVFPP